MPGTEIVTKGRTVSTLGSETQVSKVVRVDPNLPQGAAERLALHVSADKPNNGTCRSSMTASALRQSARLNEAGAPAIARRPGPSFPTSRVPSNIAEQSGDLRFSKARPPRRSKAAW